MAELEEVTDVRHEDDDGVLLDDVRHATVRASDGRLEILLDRHDPEWVAAALDCIHPRGRARIDTVIASPTSCRENGHEWGPARHRDGVGWGVACIYCGYFSPFFDVESRLLRPQR